MPVTDISLAAVMVPKGLAAVVLATLPLQQQVVGGELIKDITYGVVLSSIVLTSFLVLLIEKTKMADLYGWLLSGGFPRLRPKITPRPKDIEGETGGIVPGGPRMFGSTNDTAKRPEGDENTGT